MSPIGLLYNTEWRERILRASGYIEIPHYQDGNVSFVYLPLEEEIRDVYL